MFLESLYCELSKILNFLLNKKVDTAAIIPAFLYFVTIYFMVHVEAEKHGIEKIDKLKSELCNKILIALPPTNAPI